MDGIQVCSECDKLKPEVHFYGYCFHCDCLEKVLKKNVKDPERLKGLMEEIRCLKNSWNESSKSASSSAG